MIWRRMIELYQFELWYSEKVRLILDYKGLAPQVEVTPELGRWTYSESVVNGKYPFLRMAISVRIQLKLLSIWQAVP